MVRAEWRGQSCQGKAVKECFQRGVFDRYGRLVETWASDNCDKAVRQPGGQYLLVISHFTKFAKKKKRIGFVALSLSFSLN